MKIVDIVIEHAIDNDFDINFLGKYTSERADGNIDRKYHKFVEELAERQLLSEWSVNEFRFFKPEAGGEKVGTPEYRKYGMMDYKRMRAFENLSWWFIGVSAKARIAFESGSVQTIYSGGIYGIESDASEEVKKEAEQSEVNALIKDLLEMGIPKQDIAKACLHVKRRQT